MLTSEEISLRNRSANECRKVKLLMDHHLFYLNDLLEHIACYCTIVKVCSVMYFICAVLPASYSVLF